MIMCVFALQENCCFSALCHECSGV